MIVDLNDVETQMSLIKILFMCLCTYYTSLKMSNMKKYFCKNNNIASVFLLVLPIIILIIRNKANIFVSTIFLHFIVSCVYSIATHTNIGYSIILNSISLTLHYIIHFIVAILGFILNKIFQFNNDILNLSIMLVIHVCILISILMMKKFKYGVSFLKKDKSSEFLDIVILSISAIILLSIIIFINLKADFANNLIPCIIMFIAIMFITIQKSLQLYYKQKLLVQDLDETKAELENTKKELENANAENLSFSKKSHSLDHKQKSLEHKLNQLLQKAEISEEIGISKSEIESRINNLSKELYTETAAIELTKTGITEIDDMLEYMQSECINNKIEFNVQISGNIYHMINELIPKEDLEILLADHIKNAIIAINHSENTNRSILVKLGKIDNIYSLYIYDSGVEFRTETLENLGKIPSTTYADEGGTGMGFMNTFDTLKKTGASLTIEEIGTPSKENYTKVLIIKFDKKQEFQIKSYKINEKTS